MLSVHDIISLGMALGALAYFGQAIVCRFLRARFVGG